VPLTRYKRLSVTVCFGRGEPHAIEDLSVVFPRVSRARAPLLYRGRFRGSLLPLCAAAAGPYRL
jgi:hypothetical protein